MPLWDQHRGAPLFFPPDTVTPNSKPLIMEAGKSVSRTDVSREALGRWTRRFGGRKGWRRGISYSWGANKLLEAESSGCLRLQLSLQPMVESL